MDDRPTLSGDRRIAWPSVLTVISAAILIGAEVFGAAFAGGWAVEQLWLFWPAPIAGAILGALYKWVVPE